MQASVAVGEPGVTLLDPDTYALEVLSSIFNSFGGQLFDQVRAEQVRAALCATLLLVCSFCGHACL